LILDIGKACLLRKTLFRKRGFLRRIHEVSAIQRPTNLLISGGISYKTRKNKSSYTHFEELNYFRPDKI
jgi:hypothetical protein